jgi:hypothetical protein
LSHDEAIRSEVEDASVTFKNVKIPSTTSTFVKFLVQGAMSTLLFVACTWEHSIRFLLERNRVFEEDEKMGNDVTQHSNEF